MQALAVLEIKHPRGVVDPRVQQEMSVVSLRYDIAEGLPPTETLQHRLCDSMLVLGHILNYEIFIRAAR